MDILEKLDDIKNYFNRGKKKKPKEENPDEALDADDESPNSPSSKGSTGLIPGIKRSWVKGGAIFLTLVFVLAVIYGTDLGEENNKETAKYGNKNELPSDSKSDAKRATGGADDYAALLEENKRRQQEAARLAQQQGQQQGQPQQQQQGQQQQQVRQQPTFSQPYTLPSQNPNQFANQYAAQQATLAQQQQQAQQAAEKAEADRIRNQYQSAIAFSLGTGGNNFGGSSNAPASDGSGGNVQQVAQTSAGGASASYAPVTGTYTPVGDRTLVAGTLIPVMLLTGINTDAPGQVLCQVQSDIYDFTGTTLLIPAGSRIMGAYDSQTVSNGRVSVTFSNLQTTDGGTWQLGNSLVAIDGAGYSGISGKIHHHTARKISGGLFGSAIAALGSLAAGNTSSQNTYSAGQIAAQGALANLISTTSSMFNDAASVKSTVTVDPGYMFNVYVTNNITF